MSKNRMTRSNILLFGLSLAVIVMLLGTALHSTNWRVSCHPNYTAADRVATNCQYGASIGDSQTVGIFLALGIVGFTIFAAIISNKHK